MFVLDIHNKQVDEVEEITIILIGALLVLIGFKNAKIEELEKKNKN